MPQNRESVDAKTFFTTGTFTRIFKSGEEIKNPKFNPGDQLSVEGPEEPGGYLTAVNVYWEKAGSTICRSPTQ